MPLNLLVKKEKGALEPWIETCYANATDDTEETRDFGKEVDKRRITLDEDTE